ncbi:Hint domain-containing protein [uncultured Shimia sp.]|uniref:Hint domain-containing protein n=1 Tax=uncultured Shimia sp. TaxID=573152 RepID=UPI0026096C1B|nr:Hint domain-containing protein [uncultured Shimia sp.]
MFGWTPTTETRTRPVAPTQALRDPVLLGAGCGIVEGTQVATQAGWQPAETLRAGDEVLTFDGGMQRVTAVLRDEVWSGLDQCPEALWPLLVEAETIGNQNDLLVMPHQGVLIESDDISDRWGDPYAVIPAAALEVLEGVERHEPYGTVEVVLPVFEEDQMVFADHGALMFCQSHWGLSAGILPKFGAAGNYNMLPMAAAIRLLEMTYIPDYADYATA